MAENYDDLRVNIDNYSLSEVSVT